MENENLDRKLVAILSADVCGYSRLMGEDEEATVAQLTKSREVFSRLIEQNKGRIVNTTGDAILAEFASLVNAVRCAVTVQRELGKLNSELLELNRMEFRIGINLGDVIVKGDDIFGDGVNIAARLESIADVGGICISASAYENVRNKLRYHFEFLGEKRLKNIDYPISAYRVLTDGSTLSLAEIGESAARTLTNLPEIALQMMGDLPERSIQRIGMLPKAAWQEIRQWPDATWNRVSKISDKDWKRLSAYPEPLLRKIANLSENAWKEFTTLPESTLAALSKLPETIQRQLSGADHGTRSGADIKPKGLKRRVFIIAGSGGLLVLGAVLGSLWLTYEPKILPQLPVFASLKDEIVVPQPPSLAVLPFEARGINEQQFASGLTDDLITDLSKLPNLSVTSKKIVLESKEKDENVRELGERLKVNYVIEGSVRQSKGQVRVTTQLLDIRTGNHLWAERYDRAMENPFNLQTEIVRKITEEVDVLLIQGEQARDIHGGLGNIKAADLARDALYAYRQATPEDDAQAKQLYEKAIKIDPRTGRWYAEFGRIFEREFRLGWSSSPKKSIRRASDLAKKAFEISPDDPVAHVLMGYLQMHEGRHDAALSELNRAATLGPESADIAASRAELFNYLGHPDNAVADVQRAMRLSPYYPARYLNILADSYILLGEFKNAKNVIEMQLEKFPGDFVHWPYVMLAIVEGASKKRRNARKAMEEVLDRMPDFIPAKLDQLPYRDREVLNQRKQLLIEIKTH